MKIQSLILRGVMLAGGLVCALSAAGGSPVDGNVAQKALEATRRDLQAEGYKTDLTNFDFSTSPEQQAWEAVLTNTAPVRGDTLLREHPDLMEVTSNNTVVVVWQQTGVKLSSRSGPDDRAECSWDDFSEVINERQPKFDAACAAILAGPIGFNLDASAGNAMRLPHLAMMKSLIQILDDRTLLTLHEGKREAAWTNLLAATRLVTAWSPEPAEVSHQVRFGNMRLVFADTWQALQSHGWTDAELATLQQEWESADFLSTLPEIQAFRRASYARAFDDDGPDGYDDERDMLLFFRDREVEFHNAAKAGSWADMSRLPGVTNQVFFEPKNRGQKPQNRMLTMALMRQRMLAQAQGRGAGFWSRAAEAETSRRILVVAIALERFQMKHGNYPAAISALAPEFLKTVPVDFMNGQPLHYHPASDGRFILYSVGLDGVDNGGKIRTLSDMEETLARIRNSDAPGPAPEYDIVWPLPASAGEVAALRQAQADEFAKQMAEVEERGRAAQAEGEKLRREAMKQFLADHRSLGPEPVYGGKTLSEWIEKAGAIEQYNGVPEDAAAAIRAIGPKAIPFLLEWMPHPGVEHPVEGLPDWSDVEMAWWALGEEGKSAIPVLAKLIARPRQTMDDYSVWTENAKAISYLGPDAIFPMLTTATNMLGQHELWELLHNFENLGTNGEPAVPALMHWANDPDYWVRDGVVSALGGIGRRPDLAVPYLVKIVEHDSEGMVRRDAAEALGAFAADSDTMLAELTKMLKDPDWQVRGGALSGLGKFQNQPETVVPLIAPFLYDDNNVIQRSAAYALRDLGNEAGYRVLLQATNASGIGDIIYEVQQKLQKNSK